MDRVTATFLIVNWNTRELAAQAVESILRHETGVPCEVIVVDNGSEDGSAEHIRARFPGVTVLAAGRNLGFAGGNNLGARSARGEWLVLLNSDAYLTAPVLPALLDAAAQAGADCILACRLDNPDGTVQPSSGDFPSLAAYVADAFRPTPPALRRGIAPDPSRRAPERADWLTGAFLMVRRETYAALGGLEAGIFMYGEDIDFCRKAEARGIPRLLIPSVSAVHLGGGSVDYLSARALCLTDAGRLAYFRKWHGRAAAGILRLSFLLRSALRAAAFACAGALGSRTARAKARVHAAGILHLLGTRHGRNPV